MAQLTQFQYPENAMLNFQPLNSAVADYGKGMEAEYKGQAGRDFGNAMASGDQKGAMVAGAKIDPRLAMDAGLYSGKVEQQSQQLEKTARELLGAHAQTLSEMKDPAERAAAMNRWADSSPKVQAGLTRMGVDWKANPDLAIKSIYQDALGAQDPEQQKLVEANTAKARAMQVEPGNSVIGLPDPGSSNRGSTIHQGGTTLKTQEDREAFARSNGIQPGTEPYKQLMVNGKLPDHDLPPREASIVDQNTKAIQAMDMISQKLDDAKKYNKEAFQGAGAGARAATIQALPWFMPDEWRKGANATDQMRILETGRALGQAKTDAGSRVTAYLEQLEMKLRGSPDMPQETRAELMDEAKKFIAQNRELVYGQTQAILNRTAFKPGGMVNPKEAPGAGIVPEGEALSQARAKLSRGGNRDAVIKRLQELGIDPGKL